MLAGVHGGVKDRVLTLTQNSSVIAKNLGRSCRSISLACLTDVLYPLVQ
jgi:hypothetical protein